jgi:hypothetical protein
MGYYENPPIIQPSRGSEIVTASIVDAANSLAQGFMLRGERKRQEEKERKLTLQKLQDRKNETDLYYNDKLSDWSVKEPKINDVVDKKIYSIIQQKITLAADSRIALLNETDPGKRQEYLKNIRNADNSLVNAAGFSKRIGEQTATWRMATKASQVGTPGGNVVNGKDDADILNNTAVLEIVGGMDAMYEDSNIDVEEDENGDGFILKVSGKHKDGTTFNVPIRSREYLKADSEMGDGLLLPVESLDTFQTQAMQHVADKKGKVYEGMLLNTTDTVDLPSSGGDIYQMRNARRLQEPLIKAEINKTSSVTASGLIGADSQSRLRTYIDYTLEQGPGWYDKNFKNITNPTVQKATLTNLLTDKAFGELVRDLPRVTQKDGSIAYYNPDPPTGIKPKEKAAKGTKTTGQTGTQKNQVDFNNRIKEVINTGEGGVSKGGYTLMKMEGRWGVYDKDGLPKPGTEDITNPTILATFIGGTLKRPLK